MDTATIYRLADQWDAIPLGQVYSEDHRALVLNALSSESPAVAVYNFARFGAAISKNQPIFMAMLRKEAEQYTED